VADPIEGWNRVRETSFCLTAEACARGDHVWVTTVPDLRFNGKSVTAHATRVDISRKESDGAEFQYKKGEQHTWNLEDADGVLLRKDPPVDLAYIQHLQLLTLLEGKVRFGNRPSPMLRWNEKLSILLFPQFTLPTRVVSARSAGVASEFDPLVRKDLMDAGGRAVTKLSGPQTLVAAEATDRFYMEQPFHERVKLGDKRVILIGGRVEGVFTRIPQEGNFLSNLRQGGRVARTELTAREKKVCQVVGRWLKKQDIFFAGLDLIDGYLSEINSTSVTGILEIKQTTGRDLAPVFWNRFWKMRLRKT
jgi:glutathione synthase